jgi:predicted lipoprotein with Yx(FWY)xxD motif
MSTAPASPSSAPPAGTAAPAAITTTSSKLGAFLTDGAGRALYLWAADTSSTSMCTGKCATFWPPLLTSGAATASGGALSTLLGTTKRADGTTQVTYAGHPLYYFANDTSAGTTSGQAVDAFGAKWWLVTPAGRALTTAATAVKPPTPSTPAAKPSAVKPKPSTTQAQPTLPIPSAPTPSY